MADRGNQEVWTTISFDRLGRIVDVRNRHGKTVDGRDYGGMKQSPEEGGKCPEGEVEITEVKTIEVVYVTCADVSDPCWVYNPVTRRWYWAC
jgi:hypothetical protein